MSEQWKMTAAQAERVWSVLQYNPYRYYVDAVEAAVRIGIVAPVPAAPHAALAASGDTQLHPLPPATAPSKPASGFVSLHDVEDVLIDVCCEPEDDFPLPRQFTDEVIRRLAALSTRQNGPIDRHEIFLSLVEAIEPFVQDGEIVENIADAVLALFRAEAKPLCNCPPGADAAIVASGTEPNRCGKPAGELICNNERGHKGDWFAKTHHCDVESAVTRIEFEYVT